MTHLHLIGFHVAQPYFDAMGAAMTRACPDLRVTGTSIVHGQGGASYEALIREARTWTVSGSAWNGLLSRYDAHPTPPDAYGIVCFSAGYGAARELLRVEGAPNDVALCAFLDSIYGTMGPDGEPVEAELKLWSKLAREAVAGGRVVLIGTSDIDYVEHLPPGQRYLSTGHMARAIGATCGAQVAPVAYASTISIATAAPSTTVRSARRPNDPTHELELGGLLVQLHDTVPGVGAEEHEAAVLPTGWGVKMMARGAGLLHSVLGGSRGPATTGGSADMTAVESVSPVAGPAPASELLPGARGPDVVAMQRVLGCTPDGIWGPLTTAALARWQSANGLPVRAVWGAAERAVAERVGPAVVVRGVDVSRLQGPGELNDWGKWGVSFGAARCSSGGTVDDAFAGNAKRMRAAELIAEISYHYANGRPAQAQMAAIVAAHTRHGPRGMGMDLFGAALYQRLIAIDIEPWSDNAHDPAWIAAMSSGVCEELVRRLQALGARVGIYSAKWALDCIPGLAARLHALGVWWWIADASGAALAAGHPVLGLPAAVPLEAVRFWQMGLRDAFGEPKPIDDDRWLGTEAELRAFARGE